MRPLGGGGITRLEREAPVHEATQLKRKSRLQVKDLHKAVREGTGTAPPRLPADPPSN